MGIMTIKQIACGENHTMALVDMVSVEEECEEPEVSTKLFVWGLNDKRQLGMSSACDESVSAGNADCLQMVQMGLPQRPIKSSRCRTRLNQTHLQKSQHVNPSLLALAITIQAL